MVGGPSAREAAGRLRTALRRFDRHDAWELFDRLGELAAIGGEVLVPLWVGSILVGLVAAGAVYALGGWLARLVIDRPAG